MDLSKLAEPFPAEDVEWRIQSSGVKGGGEIWARVLAYIDARAIMDRLDAVCGPENWSVDYAHLDQGVMCHLNIRCSGDAGDEWVSKSDGAEPTKMDDARGGDNFKGGISSALKRAGSVWGIGRYLYKLEAGFAETSKDAKKFPNWAKTSKTSPTSPGIPFSWAPPALPEWALPGAPADSKGKGTKKKTKPRKRDENVLTDAQLKQIGILRREIGATEEAYRKLLLAEFGVESAKDLSKEKASTVIERMKKRREFQLSQEGKETFGEAEPGRLEQLRDLALGYCEKVKRMGGTYQDGTPISWQKEGLEADGLEDLIEIINAVGEEGELETINGRLDALIQTMGF